MLKFKYKVEKEGDPLMKISVFYINSMLTRGGGVNNTLYVNKEVIKDYEIACFNASDFS